MFAEVEDRKERYINLYREEEENVSFDGIIECLCDELSLSVDARSDVWSCGNSACGVSFHGYVDFDGEPITFDFYSFDVRNVNALKPTTIDVYGEGLAIPYEHMSLEEFQELYF